MNNETFLGFSCKIAGEQFIAPSGKRVWAGIGQLKNALHYHANKTLKTVDQIEIYKVYESLEPYKVSKVIKTKHTYGVYVSFQDE